MSIARGIAKAAKAQSRGLSGKRNSQGDFMPEDVQMKGVQESVDVDIQKYIDDVKAQLDEIDAQIEQLNLDYDAKTKDKPHDSFTFYRDLADPEQYLIKQKRDILYALRSKLRENGIEMPDELHDILSDAAVDAYDPADLADEYYAGEESRRLDAEAARLDEVGRRKFSER